MTSVTQLTSPPCQTIEEFMEILTGQLKGYYKERFQSLNEPVIKLTKGSKFYKIDVNGSVWGFIARKDGELNGKPYRRADLMKAASWRAPAPIPRGNVVEGCTYDVYGPNYLKR